MHLCVQLKKTVIFSCYFQLDMISLQPIKSLVTYSVIIPNIIISQFLIYMNWKRTVPNSPRSFRIWRINKNTSYLLWCLMWNKFTCQFTGITGIHLTAKQEQTHKDHEQSSQFLLGMSVICILTSITITSTITYTNKINVMTMLLSLRRPFINECITSSFSQQIIWMNLASLMVRHLWFVIWKVTWWLLTCLQGQILCYNIIDINC